MAIVYTQLLEWVLHRYVLHGLGKNKKSMFSSHWHTHHKTSRKNDNFDKDYLRSIFFESSRQEIIGLILLVLIHAPLLLYLPLFYFSLIILSIRYYIIHRRSHLDIKWCKEHLPWHYDHHLGKNQNVNWGVTTDWVDKLFKTKIKYH